MKKTNLLEFSEAELIDVCLTLNLKKFVAKQIFNWLHQKCVETIDEMVNISKEAREKLAESYYIPAVIRKSRLVSKADRSVKFLFELEDGETIETVLMKHKDHMTLCVSSQVGCPLRCEFCQTGKNGFVRNLTHSEILLQYYTVEREVKLGGGHIRNIVFMGMGEPLLNIDNVISALEVLSDKNGQDLSLRRMSISTAGVLPGIDELLMKEFPITLSISLHATTNEKRNMIMPVNKKYPLEDLFEMLAIYQQKTNRKITFEYILLPGFNMSREDAARLREISRNFICNVNIIPFNEVEGSEFTTPSRLEVDRFYKMLEKLGVNVTLRQSKGQDIGGACGQLRQRETK